MIIRWTLRVILIAGLAGWFGSILAGALHHFSKKGMIALIVFQIASLITWRWALFQICRLNWEAEQWWKKNYDFGSEGGKE